MGMLSVLRTVLRLASGVWSKEEKKMPTDNSDWLLFLSLEKDFMATFDYVAMEKRHYKVFSTAYLKILLAACAAVEQLGKKHGGLPLNDRSINAKRIANEIIKKEKALKAQSKIITVLWEQECCIPRFPGLKFVPWAALAKNQIPPWWAEYNKTKHSSVQTAKLKNVLDCLAGLFCLNLAYYADNLRNLRVSPALYWDKEGGGYLRTFGYFQP